jgi:hypothetical protein
MDPTKEQRTKAYHPPQVKDYGNIKELTNGGPGHKYRDSKWDDHKHS